MASNVSTTKAEKKVGGTLCCVVECNNNSARDQGRVKFFRFPARNLEQRDLWIKAVNRVRPGGTDWAPGKSHWCTCLKVEMLQHALNLVSGKWTRICSEHFVGQKWHPTRGHPDYAPTLFPTKHVRERSEDDIGRFQRTEKRQRARRDLAATSTTMPAPEEGPPMDVDMDLVNVSTEDKSCQTDPCQWYDDDGDKFLFSSTNVAPGEVATMAFIQTSLFGPPLVAPKIIVPAAKEAKDFGQTTERLIRPVEAIDVLAFGDRQFKAMTGVTKDHFNFFLDAVGSEVKNSRKLTREQKMALFLMKLKLNLSFTVLSALFCVRGETASLWFYSTLQAMATLARKGVWWFDRATVKARMPAAFCALYPNARCTIDASEIHCQKPSSRKQRVQMYSHYKSTFTVKFLVGCAPSGEVTFISRAFGGRTTDTEITVQSGFVDLVEPGDVILADKGFPSIEKDLNNAGGLLIMPPFKSGNRQFSERQNKSGYECASVRIHVERCIRRLKIFEVLTFLPNYLLKNIDDILYVIAFIVNCYPDLINQDEDAE
jgi:hypothetical protein